MNGSKKATSSQAAHMSLDPEAMAPPETPWQEFLRIFRKDYQALFGFWVLMLLLVSALAGKALTEWWVVFDPEVVRLTDKFLPPFSVPSPDSLPTDRPFGGIYLMGTDELGRDVFARRLVCVVVYWICGGGHFLRNWHIVRRNFRILRACQIVVYYGGHADNAVHRCDDVLPDVFSYFDRRRFTASKYLHHYDDYRAF